MKKEMYLAVTKKYEEAIGAWGGWEWTHGFGAVDEECDFCSTMATCGGGQFAIDEYATEDIGSQCDHYARALAQARTYRTRCEQAAELAEALAARAMDALLDGQAEFAKHLIGLACDEESQFGDCPTWGPVQRAIGLL